MNITIEEIQQAHRKDVPKEKDRGPAMAKMCVGGACIDYCFQHARKQSLRMDAIMGVIIGFSYRLWPAAETLGKIMSDYSGVRLKKSIKIANEVTFLNDHGRIQEA